MYLVHLVRTVQRTLRTNQLITPETKVYDLLILMYLAVVSLNFIFLHLNLGPRLLLDRRPLLYPLRQLLLLPPHQSL